MDDIGEGCGSGVWLGVDSAGQEEEAGRAKVTVPVTSRHAPMPVAVLSQSI